MANHVSIDHSSINSKPLRFNSVMNRYFCGILDWSRHTLHKYSGQRIQRCDVCARDKPTRTSTRL